MNEQSDTTTSPDAELIEACTQCKGCHDISSLVTALADAVQTWQRADAVEHTAPNGTAIEQAASALIDARIEGLSYHKPQCTADAIAMLTVASSICDHFESEYTRQGEKDRDGAQVRRLIRYSIQYLEQVAGTTAAEMGLTIYAAKPAPAIDNAN